LIRLDCNIRQLGDVCRDPLADLSESVPLIFAAIRRASSLVSSFSADRRPAVACCAS
jgi:hypothetical protein